MQFHGDISYFIVHNLNEFFYILGPRCAAPFSDHCVTHCLDTVSATLKLKTIPILYASRHSLHWIQLGPLLHLVRVKTL